MTAGARLFFAVWPDEAAARALAAAAAALQPAAGGRAVPPEKIHLTLAFLGPVPEARAAQALAAGAAVRAARFAMVADRVGSFHAARVGWVGCSSPPPELAALHAALGGALRARQFELEARPFAPHVTVLRRIERRVPAAAIAPIRWTVADFRLVASDTGTGRYEPLERWPLA